jgi:hypothetical protein
MPRRSVPVVLPTVIVLGLLGAWAGSAVSAVPPTPTVSLPTVTVPPLPLPPPPPLPVSPVPVPLPPPTATVGPKVDPLRVPPAPPVNPPAPAPQTAGSPPAPARRGGTASLASDARRPVAKRAVEKRKVPKSPPAPNVDREAAAPIAHAPRVRGVNASVRGPIPEGGGFLAPIGAALGALDDPAQAIPGALFAMALLAVFLLAVASAPLPLRSSPTGAMLVHKRGSIAAAGVAALAMAVATYALL